MERIQTLPTNLNRPSAVKLGMYFTNTVIIAILY